MASEKSPSSWLIYAIRDVISQGIVVVVAAGNEASDTVTCCPAHVGEAITVGSCDPPANPAIFTNYGKAIDVCAPGVDVISYYRASQFTILSGTSMSTPHVSALAAILKHYYGHRHFSSV